ncbi:MAG: UvrB/UvrC motif-containing protein, partial [Planctomycetales bacterium]|nr:UvrB/UvrC motif-containing protein [Planctomycetales bacterium]
EDGIRRFRDLYTRYDASDSFDDDELVARLGELKEMIREHYKIDISLQEELARAIAAEQYERAAILRDQIRRKEQH